MKEKNSFEKALIKEHIKLDCGEYLQECQIAFKTFGKLNKKKNNAILICHSLKLPHNNLTILDFQELLKFYAKSVEQGLKFVFYKSWRL